MKRHRRRPPAARLTDAVWTHVLPRDPRRAWDWLVAQRRAALLAQAAAGDARAGELIADWNRRMDELTAEYQCAGVAPWEAWDLSQLLPLVMLEAAGTLQPDAHRIDPAAERALLAPATIQRFKTLLAAEREGILTGQEAETKWRETIQKVWPDCPEHHSLAVRVLRGEGPYAALPFQARLRQLVPPRAPQPRRRDPAWTAVIVTARDRLLSAHTIGKIRASKLIHKTALRLLPRAVYDPNTGWRAVMSLHVGATRRPDRRAAPPPRPPQA